MNTILRVLAVAAVSIAASLSAQAETPADSAAGSRTGEAASDPDAPLRFQGHERLHP